MSKKKKLNTLEKIEIVILVVAICALSIYLDI